MCQTVSSSWTVSSDLNGAGGKRVLVIGASRGEASFQRFNRLSRGRFVLLGPYCTILIYFVLMQNDTEASMIFNVNHQHVHQNVSGLPIVDALKLEAWHAFTLYAMMLAGLTIAELFKHFQSVVMFHLRADLAHVFR